MARDLDAGFKDPVSWETHSLTVSPTRLYTLALGVFLEVLLFLLSFVVVGSVGRWSVLCVRGCGRWTLNG